MKSGEHSVVTKLLVGRLGNGAQFRGQAEMFLFCTRSALGSTQCSPWDSFAGGKADDPYPSNADAESAWSCTSSLPYASMARCLIKHKDCFSFYLYTG
jgi:hypothetical protein